MSKSAYHIRTYFSCSREMRDELNHMSEVTGVSKSALVRIAIDLMIRRWKREQAKYIDGE